MNRQRADATYLLRRIIYAVIFELIGLGFAILLDLRLNYPWRAIFISISVVIALGLSMNLYNYFTVFFHEADDALMITYGISKKHIAIAYATVQRCVVKENIVDKIFKTKQLSIFYCDYKGLIAEQMLGLKASYAELLSAHILKRMNGEDSDFPRQNK